jgi:HprK-related kinase A
LIVSDLELAHLTGLLRQGKLLLQLGPFVARIKTDVSALAADISMIYRDFTVLAPHEFSDFHVEVARETGTRRWISPLVRFYFDGKPSFIPLPEAQSFAMLEWGLNWCIAAHGHQYLIIHAAVIENRGRAIVLPAPPGSGKSTLCAGLVLRGWRLLTDELALYDMQSRMIYGMSRPINLKNHSIDVIKAFAPEVQMTSPIHDTTKGTVALLRPPPESVARMSEPVLANCIVLPQFCRGAPSRLTPYSRARTFMLMADQSFNFNIHGERGFDAMGDLIDGSDCYQYSYSQLADAETTFAHIANAQTP